MTEQREGIGLRRLVRLFCPQPHVWKETKRENLGSFTSCGGIPPYFKELHRIGIFETCRLTGKTRIREIVRLHPHGDPNDKSEARRHE